jgi:hypothetical protein
VGGVAELFGKREAVEAGVAGELAGLSDEGFPFSGGEALVAPLRARGFVAAVEEAVVVGGVLEWEDGGSDEGVQAGEVVDRIWRVTEIHGNGLWSQINESHAI